MLLYKKRPADSLGGFIGNNVEESECSIVFVLRAAYTERHPSRKCRSFGRVVVVEFDLY